MEEIVFLRGSNRGMTEAKATMLLYCLSGFFNVEVIDRNVMLRERELLIINVGENYSWNATGDSLLLRVSIDDHKLRQSQKRTAFNFELSSTEHTTRDYNSLRIILDSIAKRAVESTDTFAIKSLYYMLWQDICEDYIVDVKNYDENDGDAKLFYEVEAFICENFTEPLSLKYMADKYSVTESKFSRWFKKYSGEKFVDYLRRIRLEYARNQLMTTDYSITEIAFQAGFSNLSVFNRNFLEVYGVQPSKYRHIKAEPENDTADIESVNTFLKENSIYETRSLNVEKNIRIDVNQGREVRRNIVDVFGPVTVSFLQDGQNQKDLATLIKDLHVRYLIISDLLSIEREKICRTIDFVLHQLNLIPVIEINENEDWAEILEYLKLRFTTETLSRCFFKINYLSGENSKQYAQKYKVISKTVKKVLPKAKVGIGGIWIARDSQVLAELNAEPDYLSILCLPFSSPLMHKNDSIVDRHYVRYNYDLVQQLMLKSNTNCPIWIEGWDSNLIVGDAYNDSCGRACHSLMQIGDVAQEVAHICYSRITDWEFLSNKYPYPLFGAGGLISKDGLKKPIYFALLMNSFSGDYCLARGEGYYVTKTRDGYYCILLYNNKTFSPIYYQNEELRPEMLNYIYENQNSVEFRLQLSNIENGTYNVASYEIRSDQNNVLTEWENLGHKEILNTGEIEYINAVCNAKLSYQSENVINGVLSLKYVLGPNDFRMLLFTPS